MMRLGDWMVSHGYRNYPARRWDMTRRKQQAGVQALNE